MVRILLFVLYIWFCISAYGDPLPKIGNPLISNYSKVEYKAGNQNWAMAQDSSGVLYVANHQGLLTYDGSEWQLYTLPHNEIVRSVFVDESEKKIYVGAKEEFGYFYKEQSTLQYISLSEGLKRELLKNDDVWKIWKTEEGIVFQSFSKVYLYQDGKIKMIYGEGEPFLFSHQVSNELWVEKIPSGLSKMNGDSLLGLHIPAYQVMCVLPYGEEQYLIVTAKQGIYVTDIHGNWEPWEVEGFLRETLIEAQINNGLYLGEDLYALGTIKNGVFILDSSGRLHKHVHRRTGLQNNTVLSLLLDKQGNLWAGLDNGIDRIEVNSPFYYYQDIDGSMGTVYATKVFKDKIYVGTNQGLYYNDWKLEDKNYEDWSFKFIPGSQGQVWSLEILNNQLICGHNDGTFVVQDGRLKKISEQTGGWWNIPVKNKPQFFLQGNYTGVALFSQQGSEWTFLKQMPYPEELVKNILQKDDEYFWMVLTDELQLVKINVVEKVLQKVKTFSFYKDFPNVQRVYPFVMERNILFLTNKGLFIYDDLQNDFVTYKSFDKLLGSFVNATSVHSVGDKKYFFVKDGRFASLEFGEKMKVDSNSFSILEDKVMKNFEVVEKSEDKYIFGLDYGIAIYNSSYRKSKDIPKPIIKNLQDFSHTPGAASLLDWDEPLHNTQNNLRINFSIPWYSTNPLKYQYFLEGFQSSWSPPMTSPYIDFANLPSGKYIFKMRATDADGRVSETVEKAFYIKKPWFLQWQALLFYFVFTVAVLGVSRYMLRKKIKRRKYQLMQRLRVSREKFLREQEEENEKKLMQIENNRLADQLKMKKRELSNLATTIVYKNELLNNLQDELVNLRDIEGKELSRDQLKKINSLMNKARSDERDWDIFEKSFNESHGDFFKRLKRNYPALTPNDLKLCAYLRLNMTSKEIASIFNITTRGVEVRRYRLRKKFNLKTETNLIEFLLHL